MLMMVPSIALASWWNPFSWEIWNKVPIIFNKNNSIENKKLNLKEEDIEKDLMVEKSESDNFNEFEILKKENEKLKKQLSNSSDNNLIINNKSLQNLNKESNTAKTTTTQTNTSITSSTSINNLENVSLLKITNVKNKVVGNNVSITWETNYPTESTITIIEAVEKVYESNNGLSTNHSVNIYDLTLKNEYNFKLNAKTEDKKQTDTYYGSFFVIEKFTGYLGEYDEDKCQLIILMDSNGRLNKKQILMSASIVREEITSYGGIKITTNSHGEIKYCEKPSANRYRIDYLGNTVTLNR